MLEGIVIPQFEHVMKLERDKVIIGRRAAGRRPSVRHDHRGGRQRRGRPNRTRMPAWPVLEWKVTPLQSVASRADMERKAIETLKSQKRLICQR
jgi:hypothetical protein